MNSTTLSQNPQESLAKRKTWTVGTLTYTTAGLAVLFAWLLWGDFAGSLKDRSIAPVFQMMLKKYGASDTLTSSLLTSLPAFIGLILTPIISYRSDRHRGRLGRRIPYLLFSVPFVTLAMVGLGLSPWLGTFFHNALGARSPGLNPAILLSFGLSWALYDLANAIGNAVFGGLIADVVPESIVGRFFGMFRAVGLLVGIGFNYWMMGVAENHYQLIFIGFGLIYGISFAMTCLRVKEGEYPPPPVIPPGQHGPLVAAVKGYFRDCFGNTYYLGFFIASVLAGFPNLAVNLYTVYYAKSVGMDMNFYGKCLALTYSISLVLAYPLGWLADKFHPMRMVIILTALYGIVALWGGLFANTPLTFAIALVAHGVVSGSYMTSSASLGQRLLPRARFGELVSAWMFVGSIMSIPFSPLLGWFLDHAGHAYRYTFLIAAGISAVALLANLGLYAKFIKLGGPDHYVAPE